MEFIKTTAIGGLLVMVPIAIILFVLAQLAYGLYSLSETIVGKLNIETGDALLILAITAASLIGLCFLLGLLVQTRLGVVLKRWFNRNIGRRIPMFNAIASLTRRFVGLEGKHFAPVEVDLYSSEARLLGFLIEKLPDDRSVVFIPSAPVATMGNVYIIASHRLTPVTGSVADTLTAVTQWGVDTKNLYRIKAGTDDSAVSG